MDQYELAINLVYLWYNKKNNNTLFKLSINKAGLSTITEFCYICKLSKKITQLVIYHQELLNNKYLKKNITFI